MVIFLHEIMNEKRDFKILKSFAKTEKKKKKERVCSL